MNYTESDAFAIHGSGRRMHQETLPVPTAVTAVDLNQVVWSLMEVLADGGISAQSFNQDDPATYRRLVLAIKALALQQAASTGVSGLIALATQEQVVAGTDAFKAVTPATLAGLIAGELVPVGTVIHGYFISPPAGYLFAFGQLVSRSEYPRLWAHAAAVGVSVPEATYFAGWSGRFSTGDGATTFRLPDLRGEFVRAWDATRGVDTGRSLGSSQADEFRAHTHTLPHEAGGSLNLATQIDSSGVDENPLGNFTGEAGGAETRPRNVALTSCIKY